MYNKITTFDSILMPNSLYNLHNVDYIIQWFSDRVSYGLKTNLLYNLLVCIESELPAPRNIRRDPFVQLHEIPECGIRYLFSRYLMMKYYWPISYQYSITSISGGGRAGEQSGISPFPTYDFHCNCINWLFILGKDFFLSQII